MKILEFAFVAYPVADMSLARKFYEGVLGLTASVGADNPDASWVEYEVGPHTLGVGKSPQWKPSSDGPCLSLEMEDFDGAIEELKAHQVKFHQEAVQAPKCRMAVILDPDGNKITIHKRNADR